jgi:putative ABC transport system permease protein
MIYAQARSEDVMDQAAAELDAALLAYLEDENAYMVSNQADTLSTAQQMTTTLTLLLAGIAGISLLVGGIGIMNIMLVSVTERIREIGIRKAIGAREEEILGQFLLEAATLSLLGGVIGIILGFVGAAVLAKVLSFPTSISTTATVLAFCISLAIGLFFGVYPARKASQLDPIVALRHE